MLHHFPYFGFVCGGGCKLLEKTRWVLALPCEPNHCFEYRSATPLGLKQRRIHLMHHFNVILIQCCRDRQNEGDDQTTSYPETE
jgi:hypothetical protein